MATQEEIRNGELTDGWLESWQDDVDKMVDNYYEQIDALVEERTQAKKSRNFGRADAIRKELAEKGIVIEDSKDGVRWKRK